MITPSSDDDPDDVEVSVETDTSERAEATTPLDGSDGRAPRYGAFVFGDRIPVNLTVDWDSFRENPEMLASALEIVGDDVIPAEGGELDLQVRECLSDAAVVYVFLCIARGVERDTRLCESSSLESRETTGAVAAVPLCRGVSFLFRFFRRSSCRRRCRVGENGGRKKLEGVLSETVVAAAVGNTTFPLF